MAHIFENKFLPAAFLAAALVAALALQHVFGWTPCPLCIVQRLTAVGLLLSLIALAFVPPRGIDYVILVAALLSGAGIATGGLQLYMVLQPAAETCGPGLAMTISNLVDMIPGSAWFLEGAGSCSEARYAVLGLPLPLLSACTHAMALGLAVFQLGKRN